MNNLGSVQAMAQHAAGSLDQNEDPWMPIYLSSIAGASTCIGAAIVFLYPKGHKVSPSMLSFSLALAGSVMITVSVISLGPECLTHPETQEWISPNSWLFAERFLSFAVGCVLFFGISHLLVPEPEEILGFQQSNSFEDGSLKKLEDGEIVERETLLEFIPLTRGGSALAVPSHISDSFSSEDSNDNEDEKDRKYKNVRSRNVERRRASNSISRSNPKEEKGKMSMINAFRKGSDIETRDQRKAWRLAVLLFLSILIHNFPEGLAVAVSAVQSRHLGFTVTIGIMIHNIPEGIAIAVPCLAARPDQPWLAFALASVSGLAEPAGACVALFFLRIFVSSEGDDGSSSAPFMSLENVLAFVAGIMITVSFCELVPEARRHGSGRSASLSFYGGLISGAVIMTATEYILDR